MSATEKTFLDADETAELLGIPKATVYKLAANGQLPGARKFGKHLRVLRSALLAVND